MILEAERVRPLPPQVGQHVGAVAASVFEGIGQHGQAVVLSTDCCDWRGMPRTVLRRGASSRTTLSRAALSREVKALREELRRSEPAIPIGTGS
jgi:hypothetical protein